MQKLAIRALLLYYLLYYEEVYMNNASVQIVSMCFDIGAIFIVLTAALLGWRKGLARAVFGLLRWFICICVSLFGARPAAEFISAKTGLDESITERLRSAMTQGITESSWFRSLPIQISRIFGNAAQDMASSVAGTIIVVASFFTIFITLCIITAIIAKSLDREDKDGPIDFLNGFLGGVLGGIKGILIVSLIMLVFFPIMSFSDPNAAGSFMKGLRESYIASFMYDHNPVTMLIEAIK